MAAHWGEEDIEVTVLRFMQRNTRTGGELLTAGLIAKGIVRDPGAVHGALVRLESRGQVRRTELPRSTGGAHIRHWLLF